MFQVGQKVKCVNGRTSQKGVKTGLRKGKIYTIKELIIFDGHLHGIRLIEVAPKKSLGYRPDRFRPIIDDPREYLATLTGDKK